MEAYLRGQVHKSLDSVNVENAVFWSERLLAASPREANAYLLARCYAQNRQEYRAYHLLRSGGPQKSLSAQSRLLLAQCCVKLGKLPEAELVLTAKHAGGKEAPMSAEGLYLLGKICRMTHRNHTAKEYYVQALNKDPMLWCAFEELCKLGAEEETAKFLRRIAAVPGGEDLASTLSSLADQMTGRSSPSFTTPCDQGNMFYSVPEQSGSLFAGGGAFSQPSASTYPARNLSQFPRASSQGTPPSAHHRRWSSNGSDTVWCSEPPENVTIRQKGQESIGRQRRVNFQSQAFTPMDPNQPVRRSARLAAQAEAHPQESGGGLSVSTGASHRASSRNPMGLADHTADPSSYLSHDASIHSMEVPSMSSDGQRTPANGRSDGKVAALRLMAMLGEGYRLLCLFRCKEAIDAFSRLPKSQYSTGWVLCQIGRAYYESVDYHKAQACFEQARRAEPHRLEDMDIFSTVLWQLGNDVQLSHLASDAVEMDRLAPETWCIVGNLHSKQREHEVAIRAFQRALQLDHRRPYAYTLCGHEYFAVEDFEKALQCYRAAFQVDPRHYNAWYGCGLVYHRQEKHDSAESHFRQAITINPSSSVLKCFLGMTLHKLGRNDEALIILQQAINSDRKNLMAWLEKARVLTYLQRDVEALDVLSQAAVIEPRDAVLHFELGRVHKKLNQKDAAVKHFNSALDLKPSTSDVNLIKSAIDKINAPDDSQDTEL
eukprot:evm.model.scf_2531EXC.1 EVM.evm.TU.scf_2531EXC.1   scf_2531EXC:7324-14576(-)